MDFPTFEAVLLRANAGPGMTTYQLIAGLYVTCALDIERLGHTPFLKGYDAWPTRVAPDEFSAHG